jgi:hypothetical protein
MGKLSDAADPMPMNGHSMRQVRFTPSGEHSRRPDSSEEQDKREAVHDELIRYFFDLI